MRGGTHKHEIIQAKLIQSFIHVLLSHLNSFRLALINTVVAHPSSVCYVLFSLDFR